jgi:YYY domain-containing protein
VKEVIEEDTQTPASPRAGLVNNQFRRLLRPRFAWAVALILVIGFVLRMWGINWDQYTKLHPDERFITMVETDLQVPHSLGQYFDSATSPMNPYNTPKEGPKRDSFVYGTFPIFLTKLTGELLQHHDFFPLNITKDGLEKAFGGGGVAAWNDYGHINLVGRLLSTLADTATILVVFLTAKALYDRRVGLLAAALLSFSVLDIQLAHFFAVDSFLALFAALTVYFSVRIVKYGGWGNFALAGLAYGLGTSSKLSGAFLGAPIAIAAAMRLWDPFVQSGWLMGRRAERKEDEEQDVEAESSVNWGALIKPALGLALACVIAFVVFRIANPYAFSGWIPWHFDPRFVKDIQNNQRMQSGVDFNPNWEWVGRTSYIYPLVNIVEWGMGIPLGAAACLAFLWALWRIIKKRESLNLVLVGWVGIYFLWWGKGFNPTMRYFLPIYPALIVLAAWGLSELWKFAQSEGLQTFLARWAPRLRNPAALLLRGTVVAVVGLTALWALAFTNIYRQPLSRVQASAWMIDNLPKDAAITCEQWDDCVPFGLPDKPAAPRTFPVTPYGQDLSDPTSIHNVDCASWDKDKAMTLADGIQCAQYIVLSSARLSSSITNTAAHWPMTSNFYRLLLANKLDGFKLVKEFTVSPSIFGITIPDQAAEGNFTVYDHPKVLLYEKTPDYSWDKFITQVSDTCVDSSVKMSPATADQNGLMLGASDCQAQRAGGTWTSIFNPTSLSNRLPAITWLLAIELMSLAILPVVLFIFRALPDRGYLLAKPLGLLAVSWLVWLGTSVKLFHYNRESILAMLVLLVVVAAIVARLNRRDFMSYVRVHWRGILLSEALFISAFLFFYWIRTLNPDLWHPARGGEKPMDFAYLNAVTRSTTMPPYDPWFAGGYMNYYYFGQFMTATLIKLTGILPEIAFNLAVPMFFAMTVGAAFSVVYNLTEGTRKRVRWRPGFKRIRGRGVLLAAILGVVLLTLIGNLQGLYQDVERYSKVSDLHLGSGVFFVSGLVGILGGFWKALFGGGVHLAAFSFWDPSRMMPPQSSITEFPFFTFLFADLHAHLMAIPFDVAILGVGLSLVMANRKEIPSARQRQVLSWLVVGVLGLLIGALRPINSWDYPPFLLVGVAVVFIGEWAEERRLGWPAAGRATAKAIVLALLSVAFFFPFWMDYHLFYKGFHATDSVTPFHQYLAHFGILLFASGSLVIAMGWRFLRHRPIAKVMLYIAVLMTILAIIVIGMALSGQSERLPITFKKLSAGNFLSDLISNHIPVVAFSMAAIALLVVLAWREIVGRRPDAAIRLFVLTIIAVALALSAMVDIITLDGDIERMNTVFKFYIHVWILLAIAGAFGVWYVFAVLGWRPFKLSISGKTGSRFDPLKTGWAVALVVLIGGGLIYPISGTSTRVSSSDRFDQYHGHSNDGMDYMKYAIDSDYGGQIDLSYDYDAIQWMRQNVQGTPVIVEAALRDNYRWGARFSIYTGLPTVIGWGWHQVQQRGDFGYLVDERTKDVEALYSDPTIEAADNVLWKYQVKYVIVGQLEHLYYPPEGLAKFPAMAGRELDLVFQNDQVQIYKVVNLPPLEPTGVAVAPQ